MVNDASPEGLRHSAEPRGRVHSALGPVSRKKFRHLAPRSDPANPVSRYNKDTKKPKCSREQSPLRKFIRGSTTGPRGVGIFYRPDPQGTQRAPAYRVKVLNRGEKINSGMADA
jgi:hypothetical protein